LKHSKPYQTTKRARNYSNKRLCVLKELIILTFSLGAVQLGASKAVQTYPRRCGNRSADPEVGLKSSDTLGMENPAINGDTSEIQVNLSIQPALNNRQEL